MASLCGRNIRTNLSVFFTSGTLPLRNNSQGSFPRGSLPFFSSDARREFTNLRPFTWMGFVAGYLLYLVLLSWNFDRLLSFSVTRWTRNWIFDWRSVFVVRNQTDHLILLPNCVASSVKCHDCYSVLVLFAVLEQRDVFSQAGMKNLCCLWIARCSVNKLDNANKRVRHARCHSSFHYRGRFSLVLAVY